MSSVLFSLVTIGVASAQGLKAGRWSGWLDSPGGVLAFGLEFARDHGSYRAWIINGPERLEVPNVTLNDRSLLLDFTHYDSKITATLAPGGKALDGEWVKTGTAGKTTHMPFHANTRPLEDIVPWEHRRPQSDDVGPDFFVARWSVRFSKSEDPAVAVFEYDEKTRRLTGTFLTPTGDYRFLSGLVRHGDLYLSCFDGAHAFLFRASAQPDDSLKGDFWSRDTWHEAWTARRDPNAKLPDAFTLTKWTGNASLSDLSFHDLKGRRRSLNDPAFAGKARLIEIFGSWCPNCNDATQYLMELDHRYRDKGLSIVGLGFELTGDVKRDTAQLRKYVTYHGIRYPVLLAGVSDKTKASASLPIIDRVRAYPTTLFIDGKNKVRAIHTGFSGPATGEEYRKLRRRFESLIQDMLRDDSP